MPLTASKEMINHLVQPVTEAYRNFGNIEPK